MARATFALLFSFSIADLASTQETPGCFYYPFAAPTIANPINKGIYRYVDESVNTWSHADNAVACQAQCVNQTNCSVFTFFDNTNGCWLQGPSATLNISDNGGLYGAGTIAGPRVCPLVPDRCGQFAVPRPGFPVTFETAFPDNYQPRKGVCWKADRSTFETKYDLCTPTKVLQYITDCKFPSVFPPVPRVTLQVMNKTCRQLCEESLECAAYQETATDCFTGIGFDCTILPDAANSSGARLLRGTTRTMFSWSKMEFRAGAVMREGFQSVTQFVQVFGNSSFTSEDAASRACSEICASYVNCEFWQYSRKAGCFVDISDSYFHLAYPLTSKNFVLDVEDIVAGGYIQHLCGVPPAGSAYPSDTKDNQVLAHVTFEAKNLDFTAIPFDKLGALSGAYAEKIALWIGVPSEFVRAMDGSQSAVTLGSVPWSLSSANKKNRRLQGSLSSASTFVDTRIKVAPGSTIEQLADKIMGNSKLFEDLKGSTSNVLGAASPAILPGLQFLVREEPRVVPEEPAAQQGSLLEGKSGSSSLPWWAWLAIAVAALLLVAVLAAAALGACATTKTRSKSSRRQKNQNAEETVELMKDSVEDPLVASTTVQPAGAVATPATMYASGIAYPSGVNYQASSVVVASPTRQVQVVATPLYR